MSESKPNIKMLLDASKMMIPLKDMMGELTVGFGKVGGAASDAADAFKYLAMAVGSATTWVLVGGPKHGEKVSVQPGVDVLKVECIDALVPKTHLPMPPKANPMMIVTYALYRRREVCINKHWFYVGVLKDEDLKNIPEYELVRYFEEVHHQPFAID